MKKARKGFVVFTVLAIGLVLASCGSKGPSKINFNGKPVSAEDAFKVGEVPGMGIVHTEKKGLKIACTLSSLEFPVFQTVRDFIKIQAETDGNNFIFVNGENDINKQQAAIDDFITQKVDIVIFNAANPPAQKGAIDKLKAAGIPVVIVDRAFDDKDVVQILSDDVQEGTNAANLIIDKLGGKGNVVHITGQPGVSHANDNFKGFKETLAAKGPGLKIVVEQSGNYVRDKGFNVMQDALNANPKGAIQAVFAHNDTMALGAVAAIEAAGRSGEMIVVGGDADKDALEAIKQGKLYGTNDRNGHIMGAMSYQAAAAILNGKKANLPYAVLMQPLMVTKDTIDKMADPFLALQKGKKEVYKTYDEFIPRLIKK
jgi:ribose transport system substrate-binding protein